MSPTLRKARALLATNIGHMMVYRAEIAIWMLSGAVPLIMMAVWIGKARASGGAVGSFTPQDFAAYFLAAWLSQQMTVAWVAWELDDQIRLGKLSPKLLRPLDVLWWELSAHLSERVVRLPFMLAVLGLGVLIVPGTRITPDVWHAFTYLVCILLAFTIRFLIAYCIGLLTFWFDQATAVDEFYYVVAAFLSGGFAPLELYPDQVRALIEWTPFPYLIYYPVRVLTGAADAGETLRIFAAQLGWLLLFVLLRERLWRRGLVRYAAVGA